MKESHYQRPGAMLREILYSSLYYTFFFRTLVYIHAWIKGVVFHLKTLFFSVWEDGWFTFFLISTSLLILITRKWLVSYNLEYPWPHHLALKLHFQCCPSLSPFWLQDVDLFVVGLKKYLPNEPVFIMNYKFVDSGL